MRPYAPNNNPRNFGLVQGSARLLERIWQPGSQYRPTYQAWGLFPREEGRAAVGWLPSAADAVALYARTQPERAPEAIASFDSVRFIDTQTAEFALIDGGSTAYEVARIDVQHGLFVLESIETWARLRQVNPGGPAGQADELLPYDPGNQTNQTPDLRGLGTPFPFPIAHDNQNGQPLEIEWVLIFDRRDQNTRAANLLGPSPLASVPAVAGVPSYWPHVWRDQRYPWCCDAPSRQKWAATGPGVVRLFAKVITGPLTGTTDPAWYCKIAGRLRGFQQAAGPSGAAFKNVTTRH